MAVIFCPLKVHSQLTCIFTKPKIFDSTGVQILSAILHLSVISLNVHILSDSIVDTKSAHKYLSETIICCLRDVGEYPVYLSSCILDTDCAAFCSIHQISSAAYSSSS